MIPTCAAAALSLLAAPLMAQTAPAPTCTAPAVLPAPLATWTKPVASGGGLITVGQAVKLTLTPQTDLKYPVATKLAQEGATGAILTIQIAKPGRYQVAASGKVWIDVVLAGRSLNSVAHDHGPACSGIAKIVQFDLAAGTYTIALSGAAKPEVTLLVAPIV
jgi:hypothetical protein